MTGDPVNVAARLQDLTKVFECEVLMSEEVYKRAGFAPDVRTIAKAVGSDVTNVVQNCLRDDRFGAATFLLSTYLAHDAVIAVSEYTRDEIVLAAESVDLHFEDGNRRLTHGTITGARGKPEDVAAMVRFLCGPAARYITGQAIHANGGAYLGA